MSNTINNPTYSDPLNAKVTSRYNIEPGSIAGNEYDYVLSFFVKVMKDKGAAEKFAQSIYEVAAATEVNVLELIKSMDGQDTLTLTSSMAYYLNSIQSASTLLGVKVVVKPNYYAARNVMS